MEPLLCLPEALPSLVGQFLQALEKAHDLLNLLPVPPPRRHLPFDLDVEIGLLRLAVDRQVHLTFEDLGEEGRDLHEHPDDLAITLLPIGIVRLLGCGLRFDLVTPLGDGRRHGGDDIMLSPGHKPMLLDESLLDDVAAASVATMAAFTV